MIRAAFKALMLKHHPDINKSPDANAKTLAINEAYAVLRHRAKRAAYDRSRPQQRATASHPPPPRSSTRTYAQTDGRKRSGPASLFSRRTGLIIIRLWSRAGRIAGLMVIGGLVQLTTALTSASASKEANKGQHPGG